MICFHVVGQNKRCLFVFMAVFSFLAVKLESKRYSGTRYFQRFSVITSYNGVPATVLSPWIVEIQYLKGACMCLNSNTS